MEEGEEACLDKDRELMNDRISDGRSAPTVLKISELHNFKGWYLKTITEIGY